MKDNFQCNMWCSGSGGDNCGSSSQKTQTKKTNNENTKYNGSAVICRLVKNKNKK